MPLLTVMMPAKDAAETISAAIRSTLRAMPSDSELVVFDDASSDDTAGVAQTIKDRRIRVLHSERSLGGGGARRNIMQRTDSRYIASMDADDICLPWRFRRQLREIENHDVVFGGAFWFGRSVMQLRPKSPARFTNLDSQVSLLFHSPFAHPSMLARRGAVESVGGYSEMRRAQDYELWLRSAARGLRIYRPAGYDLAYRQSENQVIRQSGFSESLRRSRELWSSYLELATVLELPSYWQVGSAEDVSQELRAEMFADLRRVVKQMSAPNRFVYERYARRERATLIGRA